MTAADTYVHPEYLTGADWVAAHPEYPEVAVLDGNDTDASQPGSQPPC
jgi:hypothetical protein